MLSAMDKRSATILIVIGSLLFLPELLGFLMIYGLLPGGPLGLLGAWSYFTTPIFGLVLLIWGLRVRMRDDA